jgi:hypothetical protein
MVRRAGRWVRIAALVGVLAAELIVLVAIDRRPLNPTFDTVMRALETADAGNGIAPIAGGIEIKAGFQAAVPAEVSAAHSLADGRRQLNMMAVAECDLIEATIGGHCALEDVTVLPGPPSVEADSRS